MSQSFGVYGSFSMGAAYAPPNRRWPMILNALVEKLKRRSQDDFKGRHYEATLIPQAVSWYLRPVARTRSTHLAAAGQRPNSEYQQHAPPDTLNRLMMS